jgi:hypothetical protein
MRASVWQTSSASVSVPAAAGDSGMAKSDGRCCWEWPAIDSAQFCIDITQQQLQQQQHQLRVQCLLTLRSPPMLPTRPTGVKRKFTAELSVNGSGDSSPTLVECSSSDIQAQTYSATRQLHARLLQTFDGDKRMLSVEVWRRSTLLLSVDVSDRHGPFVLDESFGDYVCWSLDERMLAYVAERKPFVDNAEVGWSKYEWQQDWGERMNGRQSTVACVINVHSGSIQIVSSPFAAMSSISQVTAHLIKL